MESGPSASVCSVCSASWLQLCGAQELQEQVTRDGSSRQQEFGLLQLRRMSPHPRGHKSVFLCRPCVRVTKDVFLSWWSHANDLWLLPSVPRTSLCVSKSPSVCYENTHWIQGTPGVQARLIAMLSDFFLIFFLLSVCVCVCTCGSQRTTYRSWSLLPSCGFQGFNSRH